MMDGVSVVDSDETTPLHNGKSRRRAKDRDGNNQNNSSDDNNSSNNNNNNNNSNNNDLTNNGTINANHQAQQPDHRTGVLVLLALIGVTILFWAIGRWDNKKEKQHEIQQQEYFETKESPDAVFSLTSSSSSLTLSSSSLPMPTGVNFGSWLALEDYFFVGTDGAVEVATPVGKTAGVCLPPLHATAGRTGPAWHSETDLLDNLTRQFHLATALKVFHAHRVSYIDWDEDLSALSKLEIRHVRVPISWCFTDGDPSAIDPPRIRGRNNNKGKNRDGNYTKWLQDTFTCPDPFYKGVYWPAVPKALVEDFLTACSKYGIGATLDLHTYPGATSIGTFSGLWPLPSKFWTHGDFPQDAHHGAANNKSSSSASSRDVGRPLLQQFVTWMESLQTNNPTAFAGLHAISPMNEPAHLAGLFGPGATVFPDRPSFLPDLPRALQKSFLQELNGENVSATTTSTTGAATTTGKNRTVIPAGPHLRVLLWLRDAVQTFRASSLPASGKELHVNIHESIFRPTALTAVQAETGANDSNDAGGRHPAATRLIAAWWSRITTALERSSWAVLDVHHYHAWEPVCQGTSDGHPTGNYTCGDTAGRKDALERCSSWVNDVYRAAIDEECGIGQSGNGGPAKLVSAEFSASTHHLVRHACNDVGTLTASYLAQIQAARAANVDLYWWSYKMPYGGAFRPAWSFKHFLYLVGITSHPDESVYTCSDDQSNDNDDKPIDDLLFGP